MKRFFIVPSILSANFAKLGEDVSTVVEAGADILHFDVMDNHYVPNLSIGPMVLQSLRSYGISIPIDVHLMANPVDRLISDFANVGANYISFHPEATQHVDRSLVLIRDCGCKAGLVFNPSTSLDYLEYTIDKLDFIVLMSVNPGFSGQSFIPVMFKKIRQTYELINKTNFNIDLAVDGGVNTNNIRSVLRAGANMFIMGSAIFHSQNYFERIRVFRSIISS